MGIYIEAFILYFILFLAGSLRAMGNIPVEAADFSLFTEIHKIVLYYIPSLVLIWYLLLKEKPLKKWGLKPCKNDLFSVFISFPLLLITGFVISLASRYISEPPVLVPSSFPSTYLDWAVLGIACIFASYLEESYFRYYLISKSNELNMGQAQALVFSTLLFSICHIYEGPWGFLNAVISGAILAFLFFRYRAIHGIAIAHGLYNFAAYILNSIFMRSLS